MMAPTTSEVGAIAISSSTPTMPLTYTDGYLIQKTYRSICR
jgi:hypothetical protein